MTSNNVKYYFTDWPFEINSNLLHCKIIKENERRVKRD